jgi:hypothetical protein
MNSLFRIGPLLATAYALVGVAEAQDKPKGTLLTGAELKNMIGRVVILDTHSAHYDTWGSIALFRGGAAFHQFVYPAGTGKQGKGVWEINGDALCWKFEGNSLGRACRHHYKVGDNACELWTAPDGDFLGTYRVRRPQSVLGRADQVIE